MADRSDPRVRAEAWLRGSEERRQQVSHDGVAGVAELGPDGRFLSVTDRFCEITGIGRADLLARSFLDIFVGDDSSHPDADTAARLLAGQLQTFTIGRTYVQQDGSERQVILSASVLRGEDGASHIVAVAEDVSARRAEEDALRDAVRQKDQYMAVLAHELRNPLAPIRTSVAILRRVAPPDDEALDRCASVIERQVSNMARLVDDLLDVSRLSRGELRLQRGPTVLREVIEAARELAEPLIAEQRQHLVVEGVDAPTLVDADGARLTQVLGNLLNNASRYSPSETEIVLSVSVDADGLVISVRDHGVGIAPDQRDRVFDLFTQVDQARSEGKGGLGIGLALAKRLVEMHGGRIQVQSPGPGLGSEFIVRLPPSAVLSAASGPEAGVAGLAPKPARRRVLVADDNTDAAEMLTIFFEQLGCDVRVVHDGESAIREAEAFNPQMAVLDIGMPGLNGHEACRRIRRLPGGARMCLVALTGWGQEEDRRRSAEAGFDHHFVKPVDTDALARLVNELPG